MGGWIFRVMYVFFDVFEKVKKCIFALNFLKTGPMDLKICAKKTCNRSGFPPKILSKSSHFSKIYDTSKSVHFLFHLPMLDSKSAQSWYFFLILEIHSFLGFQNVFPKLHDPSWFCQFFVFFLNFSFFLCVSLHATDFSKKLCKMKWSCFS